MDVGEVLSKFSVGLFKIKTATGNFADESPQILLFRLLEFCAPELLFPFPMSNKSDLFLSFKSSNLLVSKHLTQTRCAGMPCPELFQLASYLLWYLNP